MIRRRVMRRTIILFTITMLALLGTAHAQPDSLWSRTYGEYIEECLSIIQTEDGGYALAGFTLSPHADDYDMLLIKTDAEGDSLWSRTFGGRGFEECNSIIQTEDGGYVLAGFATSFGAGSSDMWLVKTDAEGDSLWSRTFGGEGMDICNSIIQTADGGYALAGYTESFGAGQRDKWLVKIDADGDSLWSQTFGGRGLEECHSIIQTEDGGYVLVGDTDLFGARVCDMSLIKTNENGELIWSRTFGGREDDRCYTMIQATDGGYALGGYTRSFGAGIFDMWLIRTNADGDSLWSRTLGGISYDECNSIIQTDDEGFVLAGYTRSFGAGECNMWLVRTDSEGDSLWSVSFGGENWDECNSFIQTIDGGYALAGYTRSFGAGEGNMWLVKTGPDPTSAPPESFIPHPCVFILYPAYPNPFNSTTTIRYGLPYPSNVLLQVYNITGRQITTLYEGNKQAGIHTTNLIANVLPSGLYFLQMEASGEQFTQKVILVR